MSSSNFYIPTVNGEKAVEIDTTAGLNVDMDNDLLDYLRKAMISGLGVPSQMLNYSDEMEFARSVSMQNSMFLRSVISKQKKLTPPFTSLYRDLYNNEFGSSLYPFVDEKDIQKKEKIYSSFLKNKEDELMKDPNGKDEDSNKDSIELERIEVKFPSPSSLNATNLSEQISTGQGIVQAVTDIMLNQNGQVDEDHKHQFTVAIAKKYMPNVDWEDLEEIYQSTRIEGATEKMLNSVYNNSNGQQ